MQQVGACITVVADSISSISDYGSLSFEKEKRPRTLDAFALQSSDTQLSFKLFNNFEILKPNIVISFENFLFVEIEESFSSIEDGRYSKAFMARPGIELFLSKLSQNFNIIIRTSQQIDIAEEALDELNLLGEIYGVFELSHQTALSITKKNLQLVLNISLDHTIFLNTTYQNDELTFLSPNILAIRMPEDQDECELVLKQLGYFLRHISDTNRNFRSIQEYYTSYEHLDETTESEESMELVSMRGRSLQGELTEADEDLVDEIDSISKTDDELSPVDRLMKSLKVSTAGSDSGPKMLSSLPRTSELSGYASARFGPVGLNLSEKSILSCK